MRIRWRASNTLDAESCAAVIEEVVALHGEPAIFSTDQGRRFTSDSNRFAKFIDRLLEEAA